MSAVDEQPRVCAANVDLILSPYSYLYSPNILASLSNEHLGDLGQLKTTVDPTLKPSRKLFNLTTKIPKHNVFRRNKLSDTNKHTKSEKGIISTEKQVNATFDIKNVGFEERLKNVSTKKKTELNKSNLDFGYIKVEATGKTSAGKSVPDILFGSSIFPYNFNLQTGEKKISSLILQPSSKAIVGNGGTAISTPISRAVIKKGVPTNVYFNPESVAIAGAGGRAHAQADLILDVLDRSQPLRRIYHNGDVGSVLYGGLNKSLHLKEVRQINPLVALNPTYAERRGTSDVYFNKIQDSAARLVAIQEKAKKKGSFNEEDNKSYADNLFELGIAAQSLAQLQQNGEIKDFSKLLEGSHIQSKPRPSNDIPFMPVNERPEQNGDNFLPVTEDDPYDNSAESVSVNAPKKDASVAEAKPVGLSIAGEGGVASSKPNAVAIAGREGLAISSPKATAIAGVTPEEAAAFSVNVPTRTDIIIKSMQNQQRRNT